MSREASHFSTLDAMRGIAAIGVVVFHEKILGQAIMPGGYLAVDLFFMLSGFVIAHAYRGRMADGVGQRALLYLRVIRLWPMLALGAMLGIVLHGGHAGSLFLLPNPKSPLNLYPANPPLWSLLFEMFAYLAFAFGFWRAGPRLLAGIALLSASALAFLALSNGPIVDFGAHWSTVAGGLARIGFGFSAGMLLWHVWQKKSPQRRVTNRAWILLAALVGIMAPAPMYAQPLGLLAILVVFPIIGWFALCWELPQTRVARALGNLSYPLYCIHVPILVWLSSGPASALALFIALPCAAWLLDQFVDRPARARLSQILARETNPEGYTRIGIKT